MYRVQIMIINAIIISPGLPLWQPLKQTFLREIDLIYYFRKSRGIKHTKLSMLTHSLTYLRTSWSRDLIEKLTGSQLDKKFPVFYGK
jgi:hypothetical protein